MLDVRRLAHADVDPVQGAASADYSPGGYVLFPLVFKSFVMFFAIAPGGFVRV